MLSVELRGPVKSIVVTEGGGRIKVLDDYSLIPLSTRKMITKDNRSEKYLESLSSLNQRDMPSGNLIP